MSHVWGEVLPGRRVLLAECDAAGGDIGSGYLSGAGSGRGVLGVASSRAGNALTSVWDELLALDESGRRLLLLGIRDSAHAEQALGAWPVLAAAIPELDAQGLDVLVDLGRLGTAFEPRELWGAADLLLLVTRTSIASVAASQLATARLMETEVASRLRCLVIDDGNPYSAGEVADSLGIPLAGALPLDIRDGNRLLGGSTGAMPRPKSAILRNCRQVVSDLCGSLVGVGATGV